MSTSDLSTNRATRSSTLGAVRRGTGAHVLGRLQVPPTPEHRQAAQDGPLGLREEVVAPVNRGPQGLLAGKRRPGAASQQRKPVTQAFGELLNGERPGAGGGQLERQGDAVQAPADPGDCRSVLARYGDAGVDGPGALDEQAHGVVPQEVRRRRLFVVGGGVQGRQAPHRFRRQAERLATRGQHGEARRGPQERLDQPGTGVRHVLAVVQHEQGLAGPQVVGQGLPHRPAGPLGHAQRRGDRLRHQRRVRQRREFDEPRPVRVGGRHRPRYLQRQPRLADATGPGHRQQTHPCRRRRAVDGSSGQEPAQVQHVVLPADEAGQGSRERRPASAAPCRRRSGRAGVRRRSGSTEHGGHRGYRPGLVAVVLGLRQPEFGAHGLRLQGLQVAQLQQAGQPPGAGALTDLRLGAQRGQGLQQPSTQSPPGPGAAAPRCRRLARHHVREETVERVGLQIDRVVHVRQRVAHRAFERER